MTRARITPAVFVSIPLFLLLLISAVVYAVKEPSRPVTVVRTEGRVSVRYADTDAFVSITTGDTIGPGDTLQTEDKSSVEIMLPDKSVIKVGSGSRILVKEVSTIEVTRVSTSTFELIQGKIRAVVTPLLEKRSSFTVETNNATVGVRGTDFGVTYDADRDATYVLGLSGCVAVGPGEKGGETYDLCGGKEILIMGDTVPAGPVDASGREIEEFLEEMKIAGAAPGVTGENPPPEIGDVFLNRTIDLREVEGTLSINRDDLSIDRTVVISGTASDESGTVTAVLLSLDDGLTWSAAAGTGIWSYSFSPSPGTQYELLIKAINGTGIESDPRDLDPITIVLMDVGTEDIVRDFIRTFVDGLRNEDISGIRDTVSDDYDGSIGGFYSKDELIDEGVRDTLSIMGSATISYTVDRVSTVGNRLVGSTSWTASFMGVKKSGTTKWWLSPEDGYALVHSEGDWFFAGVNTDVIVLPDGILLEEIDNGDSPPCHKSVAIYVTAPDIPAGVTSILVSVSTYAPASWTSYILTRSYYEGYTGLPAGFGGEVIVQYTNPPPTLTCSPIGFGDPPYDSFSCEYNGYGYSFYESQLLTP